MGTAAKVKNQRKKNQPATAAATTTTTMKTEQLVCQPVTESVPTTNVGNKLLKHRRRYCRIEGCDRIVKSQGLCQRHGAKPKTCSVAGCTKQAQGNFDLMCKAHFKAMKRQTTPIPKIVHSDSPPKPEGQSVYADILPRSIAFNSNAMARGETMPLVAHLKHGFDTLKPPAWHRNEERKARGVVQVENPATQLNGWERELVWMEILVLTGVPGASFRHLARAWGRDKGFHMVLAQFICERHGDVERKGRPRDQKNEKNSNISSAVANRGKKKAKNGTNADAVDDPVIVVGRRPPKKRRSRQESVGARSEGSTNKRQKGDATVDAWESAMYGDVDMLNSIFDFDEDDIPKTGNQYNDGNESPRSDNLERNAAIASILGGSDEVQNSIGKKIAGLRSENEQRMNGNQELPPTNMPGADNTSGLAYAQAATPLQQQQQEMQPQPHHHDNSGVAFTTTGIGQHSQQLVPQGSTQQQINFTHNRQPSHGEANHVGAIDLVSFANSQGHHSVGQVHQQQLPNQQQQQVHASGIQAHNFDPNYVQTPNNNVAHSNHQTVQEERVPDRVSSSSELQQETQLGQGGGNPVDYGDGLPKRHGQAQVTNEPTSNAVPMHAIVPPVMPPQPNQTIEQVFANEPPPNHLAQNHQTHFYEPQQPTAQNGAINQQQMNGGGVVHQPEQIRPPDDASQDHSDRVQRFMIEHPGEPVPSDTILRRLFNEGSAPAPAPFAATMAPAPPPQDFQQAQHQQQSFQESQSHHQRLSHESTAYLQQQPQQQQQQELMQQPQQQQWGDPVQPPQSQQEQEQSRFVPAQALQQPVGGGIDALNPAQPPPPQQEHAPSHFMPAQTLQQQPIGGGIETLNPAQPPPSQQEQTDPSHFVMDPTFQQPLGRTMEAGHPAQPPPSQQEQTNPSHFVPAQVPQQQPIGGTTEAMNPTQPAAPPPDAQQHHHQEPPSVYDQSAVETRADDPVVDALDVHHAMHIEESSPNNNDGNGTGTGWM